jgi:hypothetical protein
MSFRAVTPPLIALALLSAGCHERREQEAKSSVTVKLPPPHPATPRPGFSFDALDRPASDAG